MLLEYERVKVDDYVGLRVNNDNLYSPAALWLTQSILRVTGVIASVINVAY